MVTEKCLKILLQSILLIYFPRLTVCCSEVRERIVAALLIHDGLEHAGVVLEGCHSQPLHHDVTQMVGVKQQAGARVCQNLLIVATLILPNLPHWQHYHYTFVSTVTVVTLGKFIHNSVCLV